MLGTMMLAGVGVVMWVLAVVMIESPVAPPKTIMGRAPHAREGQR